MVYDAADPDCTTLKALMGAAVKATVGNGDRSGAAKTIWDVAGTEGKVKDVKKQVFK